MENSCINNLLKLICLLQKNSINNYCNGSCSRPYLGNSNTSYNTRPISIYNKNGTLYTISIDGINISLFRVENVNETCVTLRALINNEGTVEASDTFVTINTKCICVVRCFDDVVINNL